MKVPVDSAVASVLVTLLIIYWYVVIFRMLVDLQPGIKFSMSKEYGYLHRATEPVIRPWRRWVGHVWGMDLSLIATLVSLLILQELVIFVAKYV